MLGQVERGPQKSVISAVFTKHGLGIPFYWRNLTTSRRSIHLSTQDHLRTLSVSVSNI